MPSEVQMWAILKSAFLEYQIAQDVFRRCLLLLCFLPLSISPLSLASFGNVEVFALSENCLLTETSYF